MKSADASMLLHSRQVLSDCVTPWTSSTPAFPILRCLLEIAQTHVHWMALVMPSNRLILCRLLLFLPSIFPSIRVYSSESAGQRWPKYWSFSFRISPSNEYSGLISFRINWFDLLVFQGTFKSLLQHSLKASILWCSGFPWWLRWWRICLQCKRLSLDPWVGKIPWRREWLRNQYSCLENSIDRQA